MIIKSLIALGFALIASGCASQQSKNTSSESSESTPFWVRSSPGARAAQTTIPNAQEIQAKRKQSSLPSEGQTLVPPKLRDLVLDLSVLLDGGGKNCSSYRFKEVRPASESGKKEEICAIDACSTPLAVRVSKGSCGNLLGSEYVSVTAAYLNSATLYGIIPLVVEGIGFLPACGNIY